MIRLTALLCIAIFVVLAVAGQDHGQRRAGLTEPASALPNLAPAAVAKPAAEPVAEPAPTAALKVSGRIFLPARPVVAVVAVKTSATAPLVRYLVVRGANMRQGPGKNFALVASLPVGELLVAVPTDKTRVGWVKVRQPATGAEGYVAQSLLGPVPPE